jgi:hypothetical protein
VTAGRRAAAGRRLLLGLGAGPVFGPAAAVAVPHGYGSYRPVTHRALLVGAERAARGVAGVGP